MRIVAFLLLLAHETVVAKSDDFHEYTPLGKEQLHRLLLTETRNVIDLSGPWNVVHNGEVVRTIQLPGPIPESETITITKTVTISQHMIKKCAWQLHFFGGVNEVSVRVNTREVTRHPGGTAPFSIQINERLLVPGANTIELTIGTGGKLNALARRYAPNSPRMWNGITREVFLVGTPQAWTAEVNTSTAFNPGFSSASLLATATIRGENVERLIQSDSAPESIQQGSVTLQVEGILRNPGTGDIVGRSVVSGVKVERSRIVQTQLDFTISNPRMWSPSQPNLYELELRCVHNGSVVDVFRMNIGLRSIRIGKSKTTKSILLNGQPIFLYGANYIEEYPNVGPSVSWRQLEHDVALMKTVGINAVRLINGAPHPYFLHLCDYYGILVMAEVDACAIPSQLLNEEEVAVQLRNHADLLASYMGSHPSLLACGLSSGLEEGSPETQAFHQSLTKILRNRISAPLYKVVSASQLPVINEGGFELIVIDVTARSSADRIQERLQEAQNTIRSAAIVTMLGAAISPNNSNGFSDALSVESQAVKLRDGLWATKEFSLAGTIVNTFTDYTLQLPTMLVDFHNPYTYTAGLLDQWRQPRVAFDMYKALINDEKEPLLQARNFTDSTPLVFIACGLVLALVLTLLINRSRRFREYFARSIIRPYNFYADIRDQRILSPVQSALLGAVISVSVGLVISAVLYYLRTDIRIEYLFHLLIPSETGYRLLRTIAWNPAISVLFFGLGIFGAMFALAGILWASSLFVKAKIFYRDTLTIVVWSSVPLLALLPIGIALYQVLSADAMSVWVPVIMACAAFWTLLRTLRATSIVFDVPSIIAYSIGLGALIVVAAAFLVIWSVQYNLPDFLSYYQRVVSS